MALRGCPSLGTRSPVQASVPGELSAAVQQRRMPMRPTLACDQWQQPGCRRHHREVVRSPWDTRTRRLFYYVKEVVGLSLPQVPLAAHSPAGLPDRCAADPTHPPAQSAHRAGTSPARLPIPRPWHRARPTCARRHVRSTFNLSTCRCASFCTCATGTVHGSIGWACFLGRQPFVGELTLKSVRQPRMRHHGKAAQPMVRRGHGLPAGGPGAPRALP